MTSQIPVLPGTKPHSFIRRPFSGHLTSAEVIPPAVAEEVQPVPPAAAQVCPTTDRRLSTIAGNGWDNMERDDPVKQESPSPNDTPQRGTHDCFQICDRCNEMKPSSHFEKIWNRRARKSDIADYCADCAFHIHCTECKSWKPPSAFVRIIGDQEVDTKRCDRCRSADAARKRARTAQHREEMARMDSEIIVRIPYADFLELGLRE